MFANLAQKIQPMAWPEISPATKRVQAAADYSPAGIPALLLVVAAGVATLIRCWVLLVGTKGEDERGGARKQWQWRMCAGVCARTHVSRPLPATARLTLVAA
jgi:hypothetical protein